MKSSGRHLHPAGRVTPRAVVVMQEIGLDIFGHRVKALDTIKGVPLDLAVTLCGNAHAVCPIVTSAKKTMQHAVFPIRVLSRHRYGDT